MKRLAGQSGTLESAVGPARAWRRTWAAARRFPFTASLVLLFLVLGIALGTMFPDAAGSSWYDHLASGPAALAEGRWWTLLTAPLVTAPPLFYATEFPLLLGGVGWCEWRFGTRKTFVVFSVGHLAGFLLSAGIVWALVPTGWRWAVALSGHLDAGPSCGAFTALVFAVATLPSPWRLRAQLGVGLWALVSVLYIGHIYDLEHAVSIAAALVVTRFLPALRHRVGRPTLREWRLLGLVLLSTVAAVEFLDFLVPYAGPFGPHRFHGHALLILLDVLVIALAANGLRLGYRVSWIVAVVLAVVNLAAHTVLLARMRTLVESGMVDLKRDAVGAVLPGIVLWLLVLLFAYVARGAFRVPWRRSRRRLAARPLTRAGFTVRMRRFGGSTMSWMGTWEQNRYLPVGDGAVAFQSYSDVAIALSDPVVPPGQCATALAAFADASQHAGQIPCVFCASADAEAVKPSGWRSVPVARDTLIDLPDFALKGKRWQDVRTAINRADRDGIEFRMVRLAEQPWSIQAQVRAISESWAGDKGLPEMRFTLGTVDEAMDPEVWVAIAVDGDGSLHGVTSWLPVYAAGGTVAGWTLDLMRRRDGGFGPVMEFLIGSAALWFAEQGFRFVSLSGAPLAQEPGDDAGPVEQVLDRLGHMIEPVYGFKSLHRFKQKFHPREQALYLLYRDEGDLPRIGMALVRAYLPDASLRQLISTALGTRD